MVGDDSYQVFCPSEIMLSFLQGLNDREEFPIVDIIILFGRRECCGVICTRMEVSVGILLHEYPSHSSKRGVGHDEEGFGGVRHLDHRGG